MLLGLSILQPTPWNSAIRAKHASRFVVFTGTALLILGFWNLLYGYLNMTGFWFWASIVSGIAMVLASYYVFTERDASVNSKDVDFDAKAANTSGFRKSVVAVLALSFLMYAVTLIQLNLGYPILR
jgi:hypothetical protein